MNDVIIIGSGPAGMGCAYTLSGAHKPNLVIDRHEIAGGLCRTVNFHGYLFDIGGHRFLTRSDEVSDLWDEIMGQDMLSVKRLSSIYYNKRYFNYPLSFLNTLWNLKFLESLACAASYFRYKFKKVDESSFDGWVTKRFGKRLFDIFFNNYNEKIWGLPSKEISADWAAQRIRGLSFKTALYQSLLGKGNGQLKSMSSEFFYPRNGPGQFYSRLKNTIEKRGGRFLFDQEVVRIMHDGRRITSIEIRDGHGQEGRRQEIAADYFFSSLPISVCIDLLDPAPPPDVVMAAKKLTFRSYIAVNLIVNKEKIFPDQWIYIHLPSVKAARIQNYKNWSPAMVTNVAKTSLGLEYYCSKGDWFWNMNDVDILQYARDELNKIGLASKMDVIDGFVIRESHAYPIYTLEYKKHLHGIREYLEHFDNFQSMGRAGLFRYNNSDHALLTGIYAAKNYLGTQKHNIWELNVDEEYLEC